MRSIIHVSDLHFGKTDMASIDLLIAAFAKLQPHLVIVSGDFTQRATISQFKAAQAFLEKLKDAGLTCFVIPGNHDISPLYSPFSRFLNPYRRYKKYVFPVIDPVYFDDELVVISINTIRSLTIKDGRVSRSQLQDVERRLLQFSDKKTKIIVTHHPFDLPRTWSKRKLVKKSQHAVECLSVHAVDMYLSGHLHISSVVPTAERYSIDGYSAIAVQAGTVSRRHRGQSQSFNVITIDRPEIGVSTYLWDSTNGDFALSDTKRFVHEKKKWGICTT